MAFEGFSEKTQVVGKKVAIGGVLGVIAGSLLNLSGLLSLGAHVIGLGAVIWGTSKALEQVLT